MKADSSGLHYQCTRLSRATVLVPPVQTLLELVVHHREDAALFSATTIIMLQCGYLLYVKYLICFISFNIIITLQSRSHLHLIDEKSKPQKDGGLLVIDPGLEPEAFRTLHMSENSKAKLPEQNVDRYKQLITLFKNFCMKLTI